LLIAFAVPTFASLHATTKVGQDPTSAEGERKLALINAKTLGLGTVMYASDFDEVFPYAFQTASVAQVIQPYIKDTGATESPTKGGKFNYNTNVGGVLMSTFTSAATVPMWYETVPDKKISVAVAYVDGHAKLVPPAEAGQLKKAAALHFKRPSNSKPLPYDYLLPKKPR
jgi:hypothetical protein